MRVFVNRSILLAGVIASLAIGGWSQTLQINQNNRTIAVTATDKADADADMATVHIGFELFAADSAGAYAAGSRTSNAIMDALRKGGVEDRAIESEGQSIRPNMQFDPKDSDADRAKKQFVMAQSWTVKTAPADAAAVLHAAIEAGANASGQIDWDLKDRQGLQAQAAAKALVRARAMADQMAKGLNSRLGVLIFAGNQPPQSWGPMSANGATGFTEKMMAVQQSAAPPLAIRAKQIEESATVYAVFAIE